MMKRNWLMFVLLIAMSNQAIAQSEPPYTWENVKMGGGGFVTGIIYSEAEEGLVYARTDVGGAYRFNRSDSTWIPLTDHLGRNQEDNMGVLSLATDPSDADRVYLATGLYTPSWAGQGAILRSSDKGETWNQTQVPFKLGGNENGRSAGERLRVDPNKGNILFLGTSTDGLWKSTDHGASWNKVESFPVSSSSSGSGGLSFVAFNESTSSDGEATSEIYVGVLRTGSNNLFRSTDGGQSWNAVPGHPQNLMPRQGKMASNGTLYLAYADAAGPSGASNGSIRKMDTETDNWTTINPPDGQGGYGGIAVDPENPDHILASTIDRWWPQDQVYRSTDGGDSWTSLINNASWDHSKAPYAANSTPHWTGDVAMNPFNPDESMFVTGYGIYASYNTTEEGGNVNWIFESDGIEETVPLDMVSLPKGPALVSALGDIDGFRHFNMQESPDAGRLDPQYGTNRSIAFAQDSAAYLVRTYDDGDGNYGSYSTDWGASWTQFNSAPSGAEGAGDIAVSADAGTLVWSPGASGGVYYSTDNGGSWSASDGVSSEQTPVADRVNPDKFYIYDASNGNLLISEDGGQSFSQGTTGLPSVPGWQLSATSIKAVPGNEGHLWLNAPQGLYRSTDGGQSFTKIEDVGESVKVGFGKAAASSDYPTIFIAGTVDGTTGFYMSTDEGQSWQRLNDDQHQFGGVNVIAGDPRVFGRVYIGTSGRGIIYGDARYDCNGVMDGSAYVGDCGECVGGNTGNTCGNNGGGNDTITDITNAENLKGIKVYPNPFKDHLSVHLSGSRKGKYAIYNLSGQVMEEKNFTATCEAGASLQPGVYLIKVINDKGAIRTFKIIKQ